MHAFFPVYFKAFYSIESILEVTPKPEQMEDNEEKTRSQSIVIILTQFKDEQFVRLHSWQRIHKIWKAISSLLPTA